MNKFKIFVLINLIFLSLHLYSQTNKVSKNENKQSKNEPVRALLIGVNRLQDTKNQQVSSSVEDVKVLSKFLKNRNSKSYIKTLIDKQATSQEILKWINKIIIQGDTSYTRFIYIGSHGCDSGFSPFTTEQICELMLWEQINDEIKKCKASKKIILVMTCGAAGITKKQNHSDKSWCYLTSSKSFESSYVNFNFKNGANLYKNTIFIESFINSLNKKNIYNIYKNIYENVQKDNSQQSPQLFGKKLVLNF